MPYIDTQHTVLALFNAAIAAMQLYSTLHNQEGVRLENSEIKPD
jgi:hypothetical protein